MKRDLKQIEHYIDTVEKNLNIQNIINTIGIKPLVVVYETYNYDLFKCVNGNRLVNSLNYTKLLKSIEKKQLLLPICVNEKMQIIDGQHRFEACRCLNKPVQFYIAEGYEIEEVKQANLVGRNWSKDDFLNLYVINRVKDYSDFEVNMSDVFKVFAKVKNVGAKDLMKQFEQGEFTSDGKELVRIFFQSLNDFSDFKKYKTTQFVGAFIKLYFHKDYSHDKMQNRLKKRINYLKEKGSIDEYLQMLTKDIYSFGAVKDPIYYDAQTKKFY